MVRPVAENVAVASWGRLATLGQFISWRSEAKAYRRWHDKLSIRSRNDPRQAMGTLSGGNQQKVLLSRWLERAAGCWCSSSRRAASMSGLLGHLPSPAGAGRRRVAVLISTSDYEEAVQVADRVYVMSKGEMWPT